MFELRSGHWRAVHASSARGVLSFVVRVRRARSPLRVRLSEELGPKEIKTLGERSTDGGVGLGLGVIPGKWVCPNCLGECMRTYCTKRDGRSRARFKNDTFGIPLDLEGLEVIPGLRGIRPKEKEKQSVALATSPAQPITLSLVFVAGFSTQNGGSST